MTLKSSLQANQLLAGLQKRDPRLYDLIRAIIGDMNLITDQVDENTENITKILNPNNPDSGLNHGQVMQRISSGI